MANVEFIDDINFGLYSDLIYAESGITFTSTNRTVLETRLKERLHEKGDISLKEYYGKIKNDAVELNSFLDSITTNLTSFFRNQPQFDAFQYYVIPEIMRIKGTPGTIRIWCAGCSTGEEPYSIAMLLSDILLKPWDFEIYACDISMKCITTAKKGYYTDKKLEGIPPVYLLKYFGKADGGYIIHDDIKSKIKFDYHNLKNESKQSNMDVIFCRNVIIYFDEETRAAIIEKFWNSMASKAFLFIGHSESLFGMETKFELVNTQWTTFYKKDTGNVPVNDLPPLDCSPLILQPIKVTLPIPSDNSTH